MKIIWKFVKGTKKRYKISNEGLVINAKTGRRLKPHINRYSIRYTFSGCNFNVKSARQLVLEHFKVEQILFDIKIPPTKRVIDNFKNAVGIYEYKTGKKNYRYIIQKEGKHYVGYTKTREEAIEKRLERVCELYGHDYNEVRSMI